MTPRTEKVNARIDKMIAALETARDLTSDEDVQAQLDAAISGLEELRTAVDGSGISQVQDELLATVAKVRQTLRTAAVSTNRQVSDYIHDAGERAQSSLRAVQDLLTASSGTLGSVSDTLRSYSGAVASAQPTLAARRCAGAECLRLSGRYGGGRPPRGGQHRLPAVRGADGKRFRQHGGVSGLPRADEHADHL